jgi:hypothetical protein
MDHRALTLQRGDTPNIKKNNNQEKSFIYYSAMALVCNGDFFMFLDHTVMQGG